MERSKKKRIVLKVILACLVVALIVYAIYPFIPKARKVPEIIKLNDTTYHFEDGSTNSCMYLLLGEDRALLIDTGFGLCKLDEAVKSVTDLPITVVNTHGHYDHVAITHSLMISICLKTTLSCMPTMPKRRHWIGSTIRFLSSSVT